MARSPRFDFHRPALHTRRTKILATLGPASSTQARIAELIRAGVNVFRLNFSHGTHETHRQTYANIRAAAAECGEHIAILGDLCGPKIRAGHFEHDSIEIVEGQPVVVTVREVMGRDGLIPSEYKHLAKDVKAGDRILIDDGRKELRVERIEDDTEIHCRVVRGGTVSNRKGINLPRVNVSSPALTEKDREDAVLAAELGVDYIALSFVRQASDVEQLVDLLASLGKSIPIISKIEKPEALDHLEAILKVSRGIMVARGDLGVEMPAEEVPMIQRELTRLAIEHNRVVIVATQMLESM
ncbi:MAG: pyruvate kinase, partial [Deltaproteobacteria bacterium CG17_big_fil_post_rev_8_21_14_2_50_63_7]